MTFDPVVGSNLVVAVATVVSTALWGLYVWYTREALLEVQRQTQLQSRALLVVGAVESPPRKGVSPHMVAEHAHEKWSRLVERNHETAILKERLLVLKLRNRGRTDIISWEISIELSVEAGDHLSAQGVQDRDQFRWKQSSGGYDDHIGVNCEIEKVVARLGAFPKGSVVWRVEYTDARGQVYSIAHGDTSHEFLNQTALRPPSPDEGGGFNVAKDEPSDGAR